MPGSKNLLELQSEVKHVNHAALSVDCVIFGFDDEKLKVLLIRSDLRKFQGQWSLLGDLLYKNENLDEAAVRILKQRTGLSDVFLEQVHTFSAINRHPAGRVVTVAYYSLINIKHHKLNIYDNELHWHDVAQINELAFDHKQILDTCQQRLQQRVMEDPIAFKLLPQKFSLRELQQVYEAILGQGLDRRNFRKKVFAMGILKDVGMLEPNVTHRPGKLYEFVKSRA